MFLYSLLLYSLYAFGQSLQHIKRTIVRFISFNRRFSGSNYCATREFFGGNPAKSRGWPGVLRTIVRVCTQCSCKNPNPKPDPDLAEARKNPNNSRIAPALPEPRAKKMGRSTRLQPDSPEQFSPSLCPFLLLFPVTGIV